LLNNEIKVIKIPYYHHDTGPLSGLMLLCFSCGQQTNPVSIPTDAAGAHNYVSACDGK